MNDGQNIAIDEMFDQTTVCRISHETPTYDIVRLATFIVNDVVTDILIKDIDSYTNTINVDIIDTFDDAGFVQIV